jgi:hypothetical protein
MWNPRNMCNRSAKLSHFINEQGGPTAKVGEANSDTRFGLLIGGTVALISVGEQYMVIWPPPWWYFGLVKVQLHPPSSIMMSAIHQVMTQLILVSEVDKLGGGMWLWGADQLVLWAFYNEKQLCSILSYMWPLQGHGITNIGIDLGIHWQMTRVEYANDVVHLHNMEQWKCPPPCNTTLGSRHSLIPKPRSTPSSTPKQFVLDYLVLIRNC